MKFVDLDAEADNAKLRQSSLGVVLFSEDERWVAFRADTGEVTEGLGVPRLDSGLWVIDKLYEDTRTLGAQMKGVALRSDGWLKLPIEKIRNAWGIQDGTPAAAVKLVGQVCDRTFGLVQEAVLDLQPEIGKSPSAIVNAMARPSSLATGVYNVAADLFRRTGSSDKRLTDHFINTYQAGMFVMGRKAAEEGHIHLPFAFPRLTYAMAITSGTVPDQASWQMAARGDDVSNQQFFTEIMALKRPSIFRARCRQGDGFVPDYAHAFAYPPNVGVDAHRTRFIPEEILALSEHYDVAIEGAICGNGWVPSTTGRMLASLERLAGGPEAARASWSVGLAAENLLVSAFRRSQNETAGQTAEAVWIAARDRAAMLPAVRTLHDMGASLVSAYLGVITVKCPLDPEILVTVLDAAWELGLTVPIDDADTLAGRGIVIPDERSRFGGNHVDYLLAAIAHKRQRRALWALDCTQDAAPGEREKLFRKMMS